MIYRVFCCIGLILCAAAAAAHEASGPRTIADHAVERVSPRVYAIYGPRGFPSKTTAGFMNNPAFIVGDSGVIVVDPGSSVQIGRELVKKIRTVTDKPVVAVFNTHVHGDHWLGNDGIRRIYRQAKIYAHRRMIERIQAGEGEEFLRLLARATDGATAGTQIVPPGIGLQGGEMLEIAGVRFKIHHTGKAHTDTDIMIEVLDEHAVFLGDIVTARQLPSSPRPQDAHFKGQLKAMRYAADLPAQLFIPGHGRAGDRSVVLESAELLERLYVLAQKYFDEGLSDFEAKEKIERELSDYRDWHNFSELGRVLNHIYREIETEFFKPSS